MIHVEIQSGAIAAFESEPTPDQIETLRGAAEWFGGPIETFLRVNAQEIEKPYSRAKLRETAVKFIQDDNAPLRLNHCPPHLRDVFRRIVIEAAYQRRVKGQRFNPDLDYMPSGGIAQPSKLLKCRI